MSSSFTSHLRSDRAGKFLGGVVEGFYGQPWTESQRLTLYEQMDSWGLNTYLYAPKDDLKHRSMWRERYDASELSSLRVLADACSKRGLRFIYGLSPGADIRFADPSEVACIKERFDQLMTIGVHDFALLFDDIPGELSSHDGQVYASAAAAQCGVTNDIDVWLREQHSNASSHGMPRDADQPRLLFCPTAYCDRMDRLQLGGDGYLEAIGSLLNPSIDVLWTGPEIVSQEISVDSIKRLSERIRRPPVIWDNLHANDYDFRRLYCGPYSGRQRELREHVAGILVNPNNEFPINHIPLRTLAAYLDGDGRWEPRKEFLAAAAEWLASYATRDRPISIEGLTLLADCYYLPYEDGPSATELYGVMRRLVMAPIGSWDRADETCFAEYNRRIQSLFESLGQLLDRELFYAWSRRIWELKEELQLFEAYLAKKKCGIDDSEGVAVESHLPGTYRGGVVAKLQNVLTMDDRGQFKPVANHDRTNAPDHS